VSRPCARVLVCVGGDVGDEFLGCEREEASKGEGCGVRCGARGVGWGGGREAREGKVVGCYCVGDLVDLSVGDASGTEAVI
jgi:hypothetical protein